VDEWGIIDQWGEFSDELEEWMDQEIGERGPAWDMQVKHSETLNELGCVALAESFLQPVAGRVLKGRVACASAPSPSVTLSGGLLSLLNDPAHRLVGDADTVQAHEPQGDGAEREVLAMILQDELDRRLLLILDQRVLIVERICNQLGGSLPTT
jgi:hypothetical protein